MTRAYEYGQAWNVKLPRDSIRWLVHRQHCNTQPEDIAAMIEDRCIKSNIPTSMIPACKRYALLVHHEQAMLYLRVTRGTI